MARSQYQFKKREKELSKKKKQEEKRQRKFEKNAVKDDETEAEPARLPEGLPKDLNS